MEILYVTGVCCLPWVLYWHIAYGPETRDTMFSELTWAAAAIWFYHAAALAALIGFIFWG